MTNAREQILQRIRRANRDRSDVLTQDTLQQRMQQHTRGPQPQWSEDILTRFMQKAEQSAASVSKIGQGEEIVNAVMRYLEEHQLGNTLLSANLLPISDLIWPATIAVEKRAATQDDKVVLTQAYCAVAETGSVVMVSSHDTPVSLNFLPDHFLCLVDADSIVNTIEDVWQKMRDEDLPMPRALNFVTGPSRTADVEQIIQMGAHGPRKVHLLLMS